MDERLICEFADRTGYLDDGIAHEDVDYRKLAPVSRQLMASYALMAEHGMPPKAIALAMLGATVNLFEAFGIEEQLPELLRATADMLDYPGQPS